MGRKIHPYGFRLKTIRDWNARWFAEGQEYQDLLLEDFAIRRLILAELPRAGISKIEIDRFLLKTNVLFKCSANRSEIRWHSYIFTAIYQSGVFNFTDTDEIREVYLAKLSEFDSFAEIMRKTEIGGLHYRAALHEAIAKRL